MTSDAPANFWAPLQMAALSAEAAPYDTRISVTTGGLKVEAASSFRDPRAPDGAVYAFALEITWAQLGRDPGLIERAIDLTNRKVEASFKPFRTVPR